MARGWRRPGGGPAATAARRGVPVLITVVAVAASLAGPGRAPRAGAAPPTRTSADGCYVRASYHVFLGREASAAEESTWRARFDTGTPRWDLPDDLAAADEWLGVVVDDLYDQALDRAPDAGGRNYWIGRLRAGALVNAVAAQIYGSAEYYANAGGTDSAFITDLYDRILGRTPDAGGLTPTRSPAIGRPSSSAGEGGAPDPNRRCRRRG